MDNTLTWVRAVLVATPDRWTRLTATTPLDMLALAPAEGQWSAVECLEHLVETERFVFPVRVRAFLAGQDFPGFNPPQGGYSGPLDPAALAADFARLRAENLQILSGITAADLERRARHGELGIVSLGEMVNEWAAHDLNHTVQAEQAIMQPFIRGCGPWLSYFQDHVVVQ